MTTNYLKLQCLLCLLSLLATGDQDGFQDRDFWFEEANAALKRRLSLQSRRQSAKNVVLLVGDGLGLATLTAARIFKGQRQGQPGESSHLAWEKFSAVALAKIVDLITEHVYLRKGLHRVGISRSNPLCRLSNVRVQIANFTGLTFEVYIHGSRPPMGNNRGISVTYNLDAQIGESSACATALLCGVKANFETVGLDIRGKFGNCTSSFVSRVESLIDWAQQEGKATGIVTNTRVSHATPAALYAHSASRYWEDDSKVPATARKSCKDIARQLVEDDPGRHINVVMGGGRRHWLPKVSRDPEEPSLEGRRLDGRNLIDDWVRDKRRRGLKAEYVWNKRQMEQLDLERVDRLLGLFSFSHMEFEADRDRTAEGDPSLAEMTRTALSVLMKNPRGFFLFVESGRIDHAHHYNNPYRALEETLVLEDSLLEVLSVTDPLETLTVVTSDHSHVLTFGGLSTPLGNPILGTDTKVSDMDGLPYSTLLYGNGPGYAAPRSIPANTTSVNSVHGSAAPRQWATHAGEDVPVYAQGPLANRLFSGTLDQSFIPHAIAYIGCLGEHSKRCQDFNNTAAKQAVCYRRGRVEVALRHVQYMMGGEEGQWFGSFPT
ncbi:hypothetical protein J6590_081381 [Homalodisca vitripennis]|nr:hypothetical protein J6590_081381 [Homalodisca vitripennis]